MSGDRDALIALAHAIEPGDRTMLERVWRIGPQRALDMVRSPTCTWPNADTLRARLPTAIEPPADTSIITPCDPGWPQQLDDLGAHRPLCLWVRGCADVRLALVRSIAIVGTRSASAYGINVCHSWIPDLCAAGYTVVSGAAYGIDAAAHRAALQAGGLTVAVLACGVDIAYPVAHEGLLARIVDDGLIVSEVPPGQGVRRQRFLTRNRVIAALTRATLVVEAAFRSGTTSTANAASALSRPVMAVPGPVTSVESSGCHSLIRSEQAVLVSTAEEVRELLEPIAASPIHVQRTLWDELTPVQRSVLDAFPRRGAIDLEKLSIDAGLNTRIVLGALTALEVAGAIRSQPHGYVRCGAPLGDERANGPPWAGGRLAADFP